MKKHIAFMISCIMFAVCFSFPVFAAGQAQQKVTTSSWTTHTPSGINMSASAVKLYGQATYNSQGSQDVIVTVQLENVTSNDIGIYGLWVTPQDNTATIRNINEYGLISGDVNVMMDSPQSTYNAVFNILGGENNSYIGNGTLGTNGYEYIVVPAHDTLSFSFYYGVYYNAGSSSTDYVLNSLTVGCRNSISGDIPHGIAVDNSDIINTLNDLLSDGQSDTIYDLLLRLYDQNLITNDKLQSILNVLNSSYNTGDFTQPILSGTLFGYNISNVSNVKRTISYIFGGAYFSQSNIDYDLNGNPYSSYLVCVPEYVYINVYNDNDYNVSLPFRLNNRLEHTISTNGTYKNYSFSYDSDYFIPNATTISDWYDALLITLPDLNYINIPAKTNYSIKYTINRYYSVTDLSTFVVTIGSATFNNFDVTVSENKSEADDIKDKSDQIHEQEQQWYSDNEAAIEATGLSNFEFSSGELDGLTQLRLQFSQVWGALGDWTLVYIFVLSLSLATFILRHRPTTKAQQRAAENIRRSEASHRARLDTNDLYAKYYYGDYK